MTQQFSISGDPYVPFDDGRPRDWYLDFRGTYPDEDFDRCTDAQLAERYAKAKSINDKRENIMEYAAANRLWVDTVHDRESDRRGVEAEVTAFMSVFHPEYPPSTVKELARDAQRTHDERRDRPR